MKIWVTRYALTAGIQEYDDAEQVTTNMVSVQSIGFHEYFHVEGKEWHVTRESAIQRAEEMRKKKITSLRKSLAKLESLTFS
jgi:hypothetical protein